MARHSLISPDGREEHDQEAPDSQARRGGVAPAAVRVGVRSELPAGSGVEALGLGTSQFGSGFRSGLHGGPPFGELVPLLLVFFARRTIDQVTTLQQREWPMEEA